MRSTPLPAGSIQIIRCGVGTEQFGLEMSAVVSVQDTSRFRFNTEIDGPAGWLDGPDGDVPVWCLAERLGLSGDGPREHLVVLQDRGRQVGYLVDRVSRVTSVSPDHFAPLPGWVTRTARVPFKGVVRLDPEGPGTTGLHSLLLDPGPLDPTAPLEPGPSPSPRPERSASPVPEGPPSTRPGPRRQLLAFAVAGPRQGREDAPSVALSVTQIIEILEMADLLSVPTAPPSLLGLIAWRDRYLPVVDLASCLGLAPIKIDGQPRFVIARGLAQDDLLAFPIHPGILTVRLPTASVPCEPPPQLDRRLARGVFLLDRTTVVVPDLPQILAGGHPVSCSEH